MEVLGDCGVVERAWDSVMGYVASERLFVAITPVAVAAFVPLLSRPLGVSLISPLAGLS